MKFLITRKYSTVGPYDQGAKEEGDSSNYESIERSDIAVDKRHVHAEYRRSQTDREEDQSDYRHYLTSIIGVIHFLGQGDLRIRKLSLSLIDLSDISMDFSAI